MKLSLFFVRPLAILLASMSSLRTAALLCVGSIVGILIEGSPAAAQRESSWMRSQPALMAYLAENLRLEKDERLSLCREAPWRQDVPGRGEPLRSPLEQEIGCLEDLLASEISFSRFSDAAFLRQAGVQDQIRATVHLAWLLAAWSSAHASSHSGCFATTDRMLCIYRALLLIEIDEAFAVRSLGDRTAVQRSLARGGSLLTLARLVVPSLHLAAPPYNDFDLELNLWGEGENLSYEKRRALFDCSDRPAVIVGEFLDDPTDDIAVKDWLELRCLELWLITQLGILNPETDLASFASDLSDFRASWRFYWMEFYARTDYPEINAVIPPLSERWAPGYRAMLHGWVEDAYAARLQRPQRW